MDHLRPSTPLVLPYWPSALQFTVESLNEIITTGVVITEGAAVRKAVGAQRQEHWLLSGGAMKFGARHLNV